MTIAPKISWRERVTSPLTWHIIGFGLLLALVVVLAARFAMDWAATNTHSADMLEARQVQLAELKLQNAPLRGLDKSVEQTRKEMKLFFDRRIPASYSVIETTMSDLEVKSGVRLSRQLYAQGKPDQFLTPIVMDAAISGDYPSIMHFVNGIERSKIFFIIDDMALTGEQNGFVNLRIRVSTWLRPADAAASGLPVTPSASKTAGDSSAPATEEN